MATGIYGKISVGEAKNTLRYLLTVPQQTVPMLRGTPGVGKSDVLEQLAIEFFGRYQMGKGCPGCEANGGPSPDPTAHVRGCGGFHNPSMCNICNKDRVTFTPNGDHFDVQVDRFPAHILLVDIRLSTFDPVEIKGLPYVADGDVKLVVNGKEVVMTRWACPEWLPTDPDIFGFLFLDEFPNAPAMTQNGALQILLDKKIHTHKIGRRIAVACAGNTEGDGSYITRLGGAAKNRLAHLEIEADAAAYVEWARANGISDEFIGAVEYRPDTFIPTEFNREADAQSTPRTFTMLARLVQQHRIKTDRELRRLAAPIIGTGAATELIAYIGQFQKIKPEEIVLGGRMPQYDDTQASHKYAAACAVAAWIHKNPAQISKAEHVGNFFTFIEGLGPELTMKALHDCRLADHSVLVMFILKHAAPRFREMMQELSLSLNDAAETPARARGGRR